MNKIFYDSQTSNSSFIKMSEYLSKNGIKNNKFFLTILDKELIGIDPFDPNLTEDVKNKIITECRNNYWYFLRECVKMPISKDTTDKYILHRGNLALNYCLENNINTIITLPSHSLRDISILIRLLWEFIIIDDKSMTSAILSKNIENNIDKFTRLMSELPWYLQTELNPVFTSINSQELPTTIENSKNNIKLINPKDYNDIQNIDILARGLVQYRKWYDELSYMEHNDILLKRQTNTSFMKAFNENKPYGIIITVTPTLLGNKTANYAYELVNNSAQFKESLYDMSLNDIINYINKFDNKYIYINFNIKQLLNDKESFKERCIHFNNNSNAIRHEVLLKWTRNENNEPISELEYDNLKL